MTEVMSTPLQCVSKYDICEGSENIPIHFADDSLQNKLKNYVCCNIPGPGTDTGPFEDVIEGCTCTGDTCNTSSESTCNCVKLSLSSQYKTAPSYQTFEPTITTVECSSLCLCSNTCQNRVVQNGIRHNMEVFDDPCKGFGLRTLEPVNKLEFVCEYAGEVLTAKEAERRFDLQSESDMNYIFALNEHFPSGLKTTYVDPKHCGNIGRFLNHSCDPNLFMVPVRVGNFVPKLCLFAKKDTQIGEELTYSYAGELVQTPVQAAHGDQPLTPCQCGSSNCYGFLPFDRSVLNNAP